MSMRIEILYADGETVINTIEADDAFAHLKFYADMGI